MNKIFSQIKLLVCVGVSFCYVTYVKAADFQLSYAPRDIAKTLYLSPALSFGMNSVPKAIEASRQESNSSSVYWQSQSYCQDQLQACKTKFITAQQFNASSEVAHETMIRNFSENQLLKSNVQLEQDINVLQSKLEVLLNKQSDFQDRGILLYRPSMDEPIGYSSSLYSSYDYVPPSRASQVFACIENQTAITKVRDEINSKQLCLRMNQERIDQLAEAKAKAVVVKQYTDALQDLSKLQSNIQHVQGLKIIAYTELTGLDSQLRKARENIESYDHWYMIGYGKALSDARTQEKTFSQQVKNLEKIIGSLNRSIELDKGEVAKLDVIIAQSKKYLAECAYIQVNAKNLDLGIGTKTLEKERNAALSETIANKSLQSVIVIELTKEGQALLNYFGIDVTRFASSFNGNALQKQLAQELQGIVNRGGKTLVEFKGVGSIRAYAEATAHACDVANKAIRNGMPLQSITWTNIAHVCERAMDIGKAVIRGTVNGVVQGYEGILEVVSHPLQFISQCSTTVNMLLGGVNKDGYFLEDIVTDGYKRFAGLSIDQRVEQVASFIASLVVPLPKAGLISDFYRVFGKIDKAIKVEALALRQFIQLERRSAFFIKGVAVPEHWAPAIEQLVKMGKIADGADVKRCMVLLEAPLGVGLSEATKDIFKQIANVLPKEKAAELAAAALSNSAKVEQAAKLSTADQIASTATTQSRAKETVAILATSLAALTSTQAAATTSTSLSHITEVVQKVSKEELAKAAATTAKTNAASGVTRVAKTVSNEEAVLAKSASQVKPATHTALPAIEVEVEAAQTRSALAVTEAEIKAAFATNKTEITVAQGVKWGHWEDLNKITISGQEYAKIGNRLYVRHAVERMYPNALQHRAKLETDAVLNGCERGTDKFVKYVQPRNIPPAVVEDAIANGIRSIGEKPNTIECVTKNVKVVIFTNGIVKTVHPI